jgi:kumamolisin
VSERIPLESSRTQIPGDGLRANPAPLTRLEASIVVRRRPGSEGQQRLEAILQGDAPILSREEAAEAIGADPADLDAVAAFARSYGMEVLESLPARRTVRIAGTVEQMEAAFGTKLHSCETDGRSYVCYQGTLTIPAALQGVVEAVLGLDQRPVARR